MPKEYLCKILLKSAQQLELMPQELCITGPQVAYLSTLMRTGSPHHYYVAANLIQ